jgi:DNA-binding XRE family transcriptional regulator
MLRVKLRAARKRAGLTQSQLDTAAGLPAGSVSDIETGRNANPSHDVAVRIVLAIREKAPDIKHADVFAVTGGHRGSGQKDSPANSRSRRFRSQVPDVAPSSTGVGVPKGPSAAEPTSSSMHVQRLASGD